MSTILNSQAMVLATAMAVSGTVIFLALSRQKTFPLSQLSGNLNNSHQTEQTEQTEQTPRSCLSTDGKKRKRKKKRVHFAENVKEPSGNSEEYRKNQHIKKTTNLNRICRNEIPGSREIPENQIALYNGILRDRIHRMECSF